MSIPDPCVGPLRSFQGLLRLPTRDAGPAFFYTRELGGRIDHLAFVVLQPDHITALVLSALDTAEDKRWRVRTRREHSSHRRIAQRHRNLLVSMNARHWKVLPPEAAIW